MDSKVTPEIVFKALTLSDTYMIPLDSLEKIGVINILNKAICRLSIIEHMLPKVQSYWSIRYESLSQRVSVVPTLKPPEDQPCDKTFLLEHVQQCCYFLHCLIMNTALEILTHGTWHNLQFVLSCDILKTYDEIFLKQEGKSLITSIQHFTEKIIEVKKNFKEVHHSLSNITGFCFERAVINAWARAESLLRHNSNKEAARNEMNKYKMNSRESIMQKTVHEAYFKLEENEKINNEINNNFSLIISRLQNDLQRWTNKYNEEVETLDVSILQINNKLDDLRQKHEKLLEIYNSRKSFIDQMHEEYDERERQVQLKLKQSKAAMIIQNWWREILLKRNIAKKKFIKNRQSTTKKKHKKK